LIYPYNSQLKVVDNKLPYWELFLNTLTTDIAYEFESNGNIKYTYNASVPAVRTWNQEISTLTNTSYEDLEFRIPFIVDDINFPILESEKFTIPTLDKRKTSFKVKVNAVGKPESSLMVGIYIEFNDNPSQPDYAVYSPETNPNKGSFTGNNYFFFTRKDGVDTLDKKRAYPLTFGNKYNNKNIAVEESFELNVTAANGIDQNYDLSKAKMFVKVFCTSIFKNSKHNFNNEITRLDSYVKSLSMQFVNDDQIPKGVVYQTMLQGRFTKPTERRNLMWGDFQTFGQNGYFYKYREDSLSIIYNQAGQMTKDWYTPWDNSRQPLLLHSLRQLTKTYARAHDELRIGFDLKRIDPFSHYAIRCVSEQYIQVDESNDYLQDNQTRYITANIGKYLNNKRFILVEGTIDYLRSSFTGVLAEIVNTEKETTEYIYSYFEDSNIK